MSTPPLISRPTKYRAWTGDRMVTVQTLCFNNGGMIWYGAGSDMGWSCVWDSPQWTHDNPKPSEQDLKPVTEWTGLLDRDGIEIYEGDVIEINLGGRQSLVGPVGRDEKGLFPRVDGEHVVGDGCRVIGDVFSTPDLLKS